jgi:hypothetical protein
VWAGFKWGHRKITVRDNSKIAARKRSLRTGESRVMPKSSTSFKPGRSGNPGGRPKEVAEVRELAKQHTEKAINVLERIMNDEKAPPSAQVAAAESLLNRGWGRAPQYIETTEHKGFDLASEKPDMDSILEALRAKDTGQVKPESTSEEKDAQTAH